MIFSAKAEYGVRLMVELGAQQGDDPISLKAIAEAEGLPLSYMEHVVADLKRAGLVVSTRGAHGTQSRRSRGAPATRGSPGPPNGAGPVSVAVARSFGGSDSPRRFELAL